MNSTDLYDKLIKDILDKADRTETPGQDMGLPAASLLALTLDVNHIDIDAEIRGFTRNYPRSDGPEWNEHLINLHPQLEEALGGGAQDMHKINRVPSSAIYGVKMFDDLRSDTAGVRSLEAWKVAFAAFSKNMLAGLDFSHIFIAGGSVLAALTEEDTDIFDTQLRNSDIDIFLYGLTGEEASKKVEEIARVLRTNITNFDERYYVERGVGALSFVPYQSAAGRKVQVVLRLAANPAEILAGFDFDQVCMGYDGTNVWMSLRGIRALCTGYTATMGALSSSFAARIVKYGSRGYGVAVGLPDDDGRHIAKLNAKSGALHDEIKQRYAALPWYRQSNFKVLYSNTKGRAGSLWTHSFSSMSALAGLWAVAHASGRIPELMAEVGSQQSMYGAYEGADRAMAGFPAEGWTEVLQGIILPAQFRFFLQAAAPGVCGRNALIALHDHPTLKDQNDTEYDVCAWQIGAGNMWQPWTGLAAHVHQFLVRAAMLTAWTCWKLMSGAPWLRINYGTALLRAQHLSLSPATSTDQDFTEWIAM
ncbi:hypothetical protein A4X13_0g4501 [Tilletia indica]|uniref:Uncharacterized protein n=1 Tax=Tilletia indica TaxID=43049 RepID=A0A8T8SX67_9BASI|nr:hypothetical protein A4X13_0g4501 [Tilletia indica]